MIHVPEDWLAAAAQIERHGARRVVVLGERDQGKSTFCRFLLQRLSLDGKRTRLLDADLGQKMVGPPACVTLAGWRLGEAPELEAFRFIGATSPLGALPALLAVVARLASGQGAATLVVNTSGLVAGPGLALKRWKLEALAPDWIVALGGGEPLEQVLRMQLGAHVRRLQPSPAAVRKTEPARAAGRLEAFRNALPKTAAWAPRGDRLVEDLLREPPAPGKMRLCGLSDQGGQDLAIGLYDPPRDAVLAGAEWPRVRRIRLGMPAPDELQGSCNELRES